MAYITAYPQTVTTQSVAPEDDNDWTNASNISADDGSNASITHSSYDSPDISYRLKATNFDFSALPNDKTIHGIMVEIERYNDSGETGQDYRVQLLDANGNLVGDNKAVSGNWPTSPTIRQYGGMSDKWNANPTPAMLKDPDFGVVLSVQATSANADIYVDFIRITVWYGTIAIGNAVSDRSSAGLTWNTRIDRNVAANGTGTIDTWEVWYNTDATSVEVATFFVVSGINYSTRDNEALGNVTSGAKRTFTGLSTDVQTGDYAGIYAPEGAIESDASGALMHWASGDKIPCTNVTFTETAGFVHTYSLGGSGTEAAAGLSIPVVMNQFRQRWN